MKPASATFSRLIVNGFVIVLPLLLLGLAFAKLHEIIAGWLQPLLDALPGTIIHDPTGRFLSVVLAILVLFLVVGALAPTRMGRKLGHWLELAMLSRLPFYNMLRTLAGGLAGQTDAAAMRPAIVTVDAPGLQQFGFILEAHADGRFTVFLPSSPNPGSGSTVIVGPDRVQELKVPVRSVLACLGRWGHGATAILQAQSTTKE